MMLANYMKASSHIFVGCLLLIYAAGCNTGLPPAMEELRTQVLLNQEPGGAITIEEARQKATEPVEVTLKVKVGNRNFPEWSAADQAIFYVSEGYPDSDYNIDEDHDPSTCPFCKWKWKEEDSLAILQIPDADGEIAPISAQQLLNLKVGDQLTVTGTATRDETDFLQVNVSGVYLKSNN